MAKGDIIRALLRMKHSPAGKKYLAGQAILTKKREGKKKEIEQTHLSPQTKKQLQGLSGGDYDAVMKMLRKKK